MPATTAFPKVKPGTKLILAKMPKGRPFGATNRVPVIVTRQLRQNGLYGQAGNVIVKSADPTKRMRRKVLSYPLSCFVHPNGGPVVS